MWPSDSLGHHNNVTGRTRIFPPGWLTQTSRAQWHERDFSFFSRSPYEKILLTLTWEIHYFRGALYTFFSFASLRKRIDTFRANICNFDKKVLTKILKFMQHRQERVTIFKVWAVCKRRSRCLAGAQGQVKLHSRGRSWAEISKSQCPSPALWEGPVD